MVLYLYLDIEKMRVGKTDIIQTKVTTNTFVAPDDLARIPNFEFMPSIHMKLNDRSTKNVAKFKKEQLNLIDTHAADNDNIKFNSDELKKYIQFQISMRKRTEGGSRYHKSPLRVCKIQDFEDRGVTVDEAKAIVIE